MTSFSRARPGLPDGFRLAAVDFPRRHRPEHGELPFWTMPDDHQTDRISRGGDR
ncbi:hypothetical protein ACFV4K_33605 [Nocardia sp. NPDC059764]|uniref:hypothetical protein n=1 Tax=Nocardia sp. NPDC059764 TaxID=3346939 RepID=UPI00364BB73F